LYFKGVRCIFFQAPPPARRIFLFAVMQKETKKSRLDFLADRFDLPAKRITTRFAQTVIRF
jgi:hypothetical protein